MKIDIFQTQPPASFGFGPMTFRVMTPDGYEQSKLRYPVLYLQDGQDIFRDEDAVNDTSMRFEKYYRDFGKFLPQIILVGIDCPWDNPRRTQLYTPYTKTFDVSGNEFWEPEIRGQGKEYVRWIVQYLKPWVDQRYRTSPQREYTAIGGSSSGCLASSYAVLAYPDVFSRLICMSGSFNIWWDKIEEELESATTDHIRYIYLDAGTLDQGRRSTPQDYVEGTLKMKAYFENCGFDETQLNCRILDGLRHCPGDFGLRFPDALRWIFQDCF